MVLIVELDSIPEEAPEYASSDTIYTSPTVATLELQPEDNKLLPVQAPSQSPLVKYLQHLIKTRILLVETYITDLPGVYGEALSSDSPQESTSVHNLNRLASTDKQCQECSEALSRIGGGISAACGALDTTIDGLMRLVVAEQLRFALAAEFEDYFLQIAEENVRAFDPVEFSLDPTHYLEDWIPRIVLHGGQLERLNWRRFIIAHAPPLVKYFVIHDLEDVVDWAVAKHRLTRRFLINRSRKDLACDRDLIANQTKCQRVLEILLKKYPEARISLRWMNVLCNDEVQKHTVKVLNEFEIRKISSFKFDELVDYKSESSPASAEP